MCCSFISISNVCKEFFVCGMRLSTCYCTCQSCFIHIVLKPDTKQFANSHDVNLNYWSFFILFPCSVSHTVISSNYKLWYCCRLLIKVLFQILQPLWSCQNFYSQLDLLMFIDVYYFIVTVPYYRLYTVLHSLTTL